MYSSIAESDIIHSVVARTAARGGTDPFDTEPLATVIDPELVIDFMTSDAVLPESELRFKFNDCEVCVEGAGEITVQDCP